MKNVNAVTVAEAAARLTNLAEHAPEHQERRLTVRLHNPGGLTGTPTVDVIGVHVGIDWDASKVILHTDKQLTALTPEQVEGVMQSVRTGQSWHALERERELRLRLDIVTEQRDRLAHVIGTIIEGVGLYVPECIDERLADQVLDRVLPGMQLADTLIKLPVNAVPVVRDDRGLWRHPAYPRFGTGREASQRYAEWFRDQAMTFTTTYLVAPPAEEVLLDDYSNWTVVPPNGAGWFLLAIEEFVDDPVCVWGHRLNTDAA